MHSFGGHSSPVTMVKFWPNENYKNVIENLKNQQEDNEVLIDSLPGRIIKDFGEIYI